MEIVRSYQIAEAESIEMMYWRIDSCTNHLSQKKNHCVTLIPRLMKITTQLRFNQATSNNF